MLWRRGEIRGVQQVEPSRRTFWRRRRFHHDRTGSGETWMCLTWPAWSTSACGLGGVLEPQWNRVSCLGWVSLKFRTYVSMCMRECACVPVASVALCC